MLDGPQAVAHTTSVKKREKLRRIPRLSTPTGSDHTETRTAPFTLGYDGPSVAAADEAPFRVVGSDRRDVTVDDSVPLRVRDALEEMGLAVDTSVWRGYVFEHFIRVREARVADGSTGYFFGPVDVEHGDGATVIRPAGWFETGALLSARGWRDVVGYVARRAAVLAVLAPSITVGGLVLLLAVT